MRSTTSSLSRASSRVSDQLKSYFAKHLDPTKGPYPKDLGALPAIEAAQDAFDTRLTESFKAAFTEVEGMGYDKLFGAKGKSETDLKNEGPTTKRPSDGRGGSSA